MRTQFISAALLTLAVAAPLWAGQHQPRGNPGGAASHYGGGQVYRQAPVQRQAHYSQRTQPEYRQPAARPQYGSRPQEAVRQPRTSMERGPRSQPAPHTNVAPGMAPRREQAMPGRNMASPARNGFQGQPHGNPEARGQGQPGTGQQQMQPNVPRPPSASRPLVRGQGPHNGDWLRNTLKLPPQEQQRKLEQDQHFRQLPPQRQEQLKNRLQNFNSMPPDKRQRVLNRMEMIERLRPEQQKQAQALYGQFRSMDPQRKDVMRRTLRQMRGMPPDARERMLNSPDMQSRYSQQEIDMLRGFNGLGFAGQER